MRICCGGGLVVMVVVGSIVEELEEAWEKDLQSYQSCDFI